MGGAGEARRRWGWDLNGGMGKHSLFNSSLSLLRWKSGVSVFNGSQLMPTKVSNNGGLRAQPLDAPLTLVFGAGNIAGIISTKEER